MSFFCCPLRKKLAIVSNDHREFLLLLIVASFVCRPLHIILATMSTHYRKCLLWYFTETLENTNYRDMIWLPLTTEVRDNIKLLSRTVSVVLWRKNRDDINLLSRVFPLSFMKAAYGTINLLSLASSCFFTKEFCANLTYDREFLLFTDTEYIRDNVGWLSQVFLLSCTEICDNQSIIARLFCCPVQKQLAILSAYYRELFLLLLLEEEARDNIETVSLIFRSLLQERLTII